jgi:hypothetical protein
MLSCKQSIGTITTEWLNHCNCIFELLQLKAENYCNCNSYIGSSVIDHWNRCNRVNIVYPKSVSFSIQLIMLHFRNQYFRNEIRTLIRSNHVMHIGFHPLDTVTTIVPVSCNRSNTWLQLHWFAPCSCNRSDTLLQ